MFTFWKETSIPQQNDKKVVTVNVNKIDKIGSIFSLVFRNLFEQKAVFQAVKAFGSYHYPVGLE